MSCIVALREGKQVIMACDSAFSLDPSGLVLAAASPRKIIQMPLVDTDDAQVLIGVCGSAAVLCALSDAMDSESVEHNEYEEVIFGLVHTHINAVLEEEALWEEFRARGNPTSILVAVNDKLYRIEGKHHWMELVASSAAIGSGAEVALGALAALQHPAVEGAPKGVELLTTTLDIVAEYDVGVKPPYYLVSTTVLPSNGQG